MTTIYIATSNPGKVRDFAGAASLFRIDVAPLPGFAALPPVHEDGETFESNARKKAECYSREAPTKESLVLADDSGLEVFSLNGAPGVHSARYASDDSAAVVTTPGEQDHDAANNARLLRELESVPDSDRAARFVCALAVAREGRVLKIFEAEVRGTILRAPRGQNGFGYDPLFLVPEIGKTTAELTAQEKAAISHRGRAFQKFLEWYRGENA